MFSHADLCASTGSRQRLARVHTPRIVIAERSSCSKTSVRCQLVQDGELFLQGKEPTIVERASRTGRANRRDQIWHDIDLFEMQMALRSAGVVRLWQFETEVRADNDFTSFGYRKDYDAIVTFGVNGSSAQVALEYERTGNRRVNTSGSAPS